MITFPYIVNILLKFNINMFITYAACWMANSPKYISAGVFLFSDWWGRSKYCFNAFIRSLTFEYFLMYIFSYFTKRHKHSMKISGLPKRWIVLCSEFTQNVIHRCWHFPAQHIAAVSIHGLNRSKMQHCHKWSPARIWWLKWQKGVIHRFRYWTKTVD